MLSTLHTIVSAAVFLMVVGTIICACWCAWCWFVAPILERRQYHYLQMRMPGGKDRDGHETVQQAVRRLAR